MSHSKVSVALTDGVVRPGASSAKTSPRAGSPNHQDDSKETRTLPPNTLVAGAPRLGKHCPAWTAGRWPR